MDYIKELHELCETLSRALKEANEKLRNAGGKVSSSDMDYIDKLTHSLKSIKATIKMIEDEEMDDGYSERYSRDGGSYRGGYSRDGGSYRYSRDGSYRPYEGGSYGRGRYAKRDSMGRYSSDYSGHGDMVEELRAMMQDAPDEQTRQEMQRLIQKMEQR